MSLKNVANEDLLVKFSNSAGPPGIVYSGDVGIDAVSVKPILTIKCKASDKKIATTAITIVWTVASPCPHTAAGFTFVAGAGSIAATATKTKASGGLVLRVEDAGTCAGSWTKNSDGTVVACACACEISDAGQSEAKAQ